MQLAIIKKLKIWISHILSTYWIFINDACSLNEREKTEGILREKQVLYRLSCQILDVLGWVEELVPHCVWIFLVCLCVPLKHLNLTNRQCVVISWSNVWLSTEQLLFYRIIQWSSFIYYFVIYLEYFPIVVEIMRKEHIIVQIPFASLLIGLWPDSFFVESWHLDTLIY